MRIIFLLSLIFFVSSCSTRSGLTGKYPVQEKTKLTSLTFIPQEKYQCGPSSLAMMVSHLDQTGLSKDFSSMVFTPNKEGSFQSDMVSAVRREKLLPLRIKDFGSLLMELDSGNPVLILQNLGLNWIPRWHYAVVIGYDLNKSQMILHSGTKAYSRMSVFTFQKTWDRSDNWGLLIVKPGTVPKSVSELDLVSEIAHLEEQKFYEEARVGYESVLVKFPKSLGALLGLGNVYFARKNFTLSASYLKHATIHHPDSAEAWHNLAIAWESSGNLVRAKEAARKAVSVCSSEKKVLFQQHLKTLL